MITKLLTASTSAARLDEYLKDNFQEVYDFFNDEKYSILLEQRDAIHRYLAFNIRVIRELDIHNKNNLAFLFLLLDVSERLSYFNEFGTLFDHLDRQHFNFGKRLRAASFYLIDVNSADDYIERFDAFYRLLQVAYETEEDNNSKVLATLINYYSLLIYNFEFNPQASIRLREKILEYIAKEPLSFLHHPLLDDVMAVPIEPHDLAYAVIHQKLDSFLGRDIIRIYSPENLLIETGTEYDRLIRQSNPDFDSIRNVSLQLYDNDDAVFYSLQRGVKVLDQEKQLFAYMFSYGKMHKSKLFSAFEYLPASFFQSTLRVVDWGCGQALATVAYFSFLRGKGINQDVRHITLIEPSKVALTRGALHACFCSGGNNVRTAHKDIDSLVADDLVDSIPTTKLHLLSNIIDVELFVLGDMLELIKNCYSGTNYFICVSPYVNDVKTKRIDLFVEFFSKFPGFELYATLDDKAGKWIGNWTRVVRVFKVNL